LFAATQAAIALSAVIVLAGGGISYPHGTWAGAFGNKNHLGFGCGLSALAGAHLVVHEFRTRRWHRLIIVSLPMGFSLWMLFFKTGNASGPAGLLVASTGGALAIASQGYLRERNPRLGNDLAAVIFLPVCVLVIFAGAFTGRELLTGLVGRSPNFTGRTTQWSEGLQGAIERPITGWGWWAAHDNPDFTGLFERYSGFTTHSFWIQTALGSGIPGFVLTMLAITLGLIALSKAFFRRQLAVVPAVAIPLYALVFLSAEDVRSQYAMSLAVLVLFMFEAARNTAQRVTADSTGHRSGRQFGQ
jgi:O-antigen ligase